jgi:hypothetical protein
LVEYGATFDANDQAVTLGWLKNSFSVPSTINMGNGLWTITSKSATPFYAWYVPYITINAEGSTLKFTDSTNDALTFAGASKIYNNLYCIMVSRNI